MLQVDDGGAVNVTTAAASLDLKGIGTVASNATLSDLGSVLVDFNGFLDDSGTLSVGSGGTFSDLNNVVIEKAPLFRTAARSTWPPARHWIWRAAVP